MKKMVIPGILTILFIVSLVLYYQMFRWWMDTWTTFVLYHVLLGLAMGGMALTVVLTKGQTYPVVPKVIVSILAFIVAAAIPIGASFGLDAALFQYKHYHQCAVLVCGINLLVFSTLLFVYCNGSFPSWAKALRAVYAVLLLVSVTGMVFGIGGYKVAHPVYRLIYGSGGHVTSNENLTYAFTEMDVAFSQTDSIDGAADVMLTLEEGEEKGIQLVLAADKQAESISVTVTDFVGVNGGALATRVYYGEYADSQHRLAAMHLSSSYPHWLKPAENSQISVAAGTNHGVYILVDAPVGTAPGDYTATLTVKNSGGEVVLEKQIKATVSGSQVLKFREDGKFKILQFADIHSCPLRETEKQLLKDAIERTQPDLILLTGDNAFSVSGEAGAAIADFMDIFEEYEIPVAMVFGNHDTESRPTKIQQMGIYSSYDCFVGAIGTPIGNRIGNYNLPILSSDGTRTAFNLWFVDSGMNNDENDLGGYACVLKEQVDWYVAASNALTEANGGEKIPSINIQHIIVPEVKEVLIPTDDEERWLLPEGNDGHMGEIYGGPLYSNGQFDAFVSQGDVLATIAGHDHANSFVVENRGVDIIVSPICTFIGSNDESIGYRVFELDETNPWSYETYVDEYWEIYKDDPAMLEKLRELS